MTIHKHSYHRSTSGLIPPIENRSFDSLFVHEYQLEDDACALLTALLEQAPDQSSAAATLFRLPEATNIDWVIEIGPAATGWTPKLAYPDIIDGPALLNLAAILRDVNLWYCSADFQGERWHAESRSAANAIETLACEVAPGWRHEFGLLRAGVNFTATADFSLLLGEALFECAGIERLLPIAGAVGLGKDGLFVELAAQVKGAKCELLGGKLKIELQRVRARASGLDDPEHVSVFAFTLEGSLSVGVRSAKVTLGATQNGKLISVLVEADEGTECQGWLEGLLPDARSHIALPGNCSNAVPQLQRLHALVPLSGSGRPSATFVLGYQHDLSLFDDMVKLRPSLTLRTDFTARGTRVELASQWIIHPEAADETRFDVMIRLPEGDASIALAPGYRLNLPASLNELLAPVRAGQTALHLVHMVLDGNVRSGDFSVEIHTIGHLAFPIQDTTLTLGDIDFELSREQGEWSSSLSAVLALGDYELQLQADIGPSMSFLVNVPSISLSSLCTDLFKIEPHEALVDASIERCLLELEIGDLFSFNFLAASRSVVKIGGLGILIEELSGSYSTDTPLTLRGKAQLTAGKTQVSLDLGYTAGTWQFKAAATTELDLAALIRDLAGTLGFESPLPTTRLDIRTFALDVRLGKAGTRIALHCGFGLGSDRLHRLLLVAGKPLDEEARQSSWQYLLEVGELAIDLFETPLIGGSLRSVANTARAISSDPSKPVMVGLDHLAIRLTSTCDPTQLDALFQDLDVAHFVRPSLLGGKVSVHADLTVLDYHRVLDYPRLPEPPRDLEKPNTKPATASLEKASPNVGKTLVAPAEVDRGLATEPDKGYWLPLDRRVGPVMLERLGVDVGATGLSFMLDASAAFGPVRLGLVGLEAKTPLKLPLTPEFSLKGVSVGATTDALSLSGGLLVRGDNSYAGAVTIGFGKIALTAIGTYSETRLAPGEPTTAHVALLAVLDTPLGGPPVFYIIGLAGGVGHNMSWADVALADVGAHPMLRALENGKADSRALDRLGQICSPRVGEHWAAVGVKFTSFKIINGVALLVLSLGEETRLQVLAKLDLTFPPKSALGERSPLVHADILVRAEYRPAAGELKVDGMLAPGAFLLSEQAQITGGFALYSWFSPSPHAGDFVLTLGGYHPRFKVPAHYPRVERLALNWKLSEQVQIKGEQYFALTPSAIMAGGLLEVNYRAGWGSASFRAQADFIIFFQPFAYEASVRIAVHVEAELKAWPITLKLSLDLAVSMDLWGPPFGALAKISFYGLSKDISLGAERPASTPIVSWADFRASFLPLANAAERELDRPLIDGAPTLTDSLITLTPSSGLLARLDARSGKRLDEGASPEQTATAHWLIDPGALSIELALSVPARTLDLDGAPQSGGASFGIGPMNLTHAQITSHLSLTVGRQGDWQLKPILSPVAAGLWSPSGRPAASSPPEQQVVADALTGVRLSLDVKRPDFFSANKSSTPVANGYKAWWVLDHVHPVVTDPNLKMLRTTLTQPEVETRRSAVLAAIEDIYNDIYAKEKELGERHGLHRAARVSALTALSGLDQLLAPDNGVFADTPLLCRWGDV